MLLSWTTQTWTVCCNCRVRVDQISCMTESADSHTWLWLLRVSLLRNCGRHFVGGSRSTKKTLIGGVVTTHAVVRTIVTCRCHANMAAGAGTGGEKQTFSPGTTAKSQRAIHSASSSTAGSNIKQGGAS